LEGFPDTFSRRHNTYLTGNPVRSDIAAIGGETRAEPNRACHVLVVGGSRGARALNENVPELLDQSIAGSASSVIVCHQSGEQEFESTRARYQAFNNGIQFEVCTFLDDMADRYRWADIVVCRAGAMTVAELTAAGKPALLVPFPYAIDDHQTENARWLADQGAGLLVPQTDLLNELTIEQFAELINSVVKRNEMADRARQLAITDAASRVARHCTELTSLESDP